MTLESTTKLAEGTPLTFLGKSVELNQAERSISLQIPLASYHAAFGTTWLRRCNNTK